jgi:hypothetical protein
MSKPRKNPSAREKQRARQERARAGRQEQAAAGHPLMALKPPYSGYLGWITPETVTVGEDAGEEARELHATLVRLAPLYAGRVPMAAVHLERHIRSGTLPIAAPGAPDRVSLVPVADLVASTANPWVEAAFRAAHPDVPDDELGLSADLEEAAEHIHGLHFHGALVLDNDHIIRLAVLV